MTGRSKDEPQDNSQDDALAWLGRASTYGGVPVRRIDTHAGIVFLAGARALKVKRAVRFPFLDFSTLAKRRAACLAEIDANRPFAPELYRGVIAVTRGRTAGLRSAATASRSSGRSTCAASTSARRSITSPRRQNDARDRRQLARGVTRPTPSAAREAAPGPSACATTSRRTNRIPRRIDCFRKTLRRTHRRERLALATPSHAARGARQGRPRAPLYGDLHLGNIALIGGGRCRSTPSSSIPPSPPSTCSTTSPSCSWTCRAQLEPAANASSTATS